MNLHNTSRESELEIYQTKVIRFSDVNSRLNEMLSNGACDAQTYYKHDMRNPSLEGEIFNVTDL